MKRVLALAFALLSVPFASDLKPTKDLAVMNITATDFEGHAQKHKELLFKGQQNGKEIQVVTDARGEASTHIPKGDTYTVLCEGITGSFECGATPFIPLKAGTGAVNVEFEDTKFDLKGVTFETGKSELKPASYGILNSTVKGLQKFDSVKVEIEGHTDNVGGEEYNIKLSQDRANSVRAYLVGKGIKADRITAVGYGYSSPRADNDSEAGRAQNRRIEIRIVNVAPKE
jgi:outer membrane protein OmpA-like peptidoglycan-associated protein